MKVMAKEEARQMNGGSYQCLTRDYVMRLNNTGICYKICLTKAGLGWHFMYAHPDEAWRYRIL